MHGVQSLRLIAHAIADAPLVYVVSVAYLIAAVWLLVSLERSSSGSDA